MRIGGICQWGDMMVDKARYIKQNAHLYDKFVVYGQMEWQTYRSWGFNDMLDAANSQNRKLICITGAASLKEDFPYNNIIVENYPTSFFTDAYCRLYTYDDHMPVYIDKLNSDNFTHPFITLNHRAHIHRCEMIDLVYKNNLFDKNVIVWHNAENNDFYKFKYWQPHELKLNDSYTKTFNMYKLPTQYFNCFAQLVSEATEEATFVTEKTATPLFLKKPFLVASVVGYHKFLQNLGFVLYDEIFDYSFDNIEDRTIRYESLLQNFVKLNNIKPQELTELYHMISEKLEYNRLRIVEVAKNYLYTSPTMAETIKLQSQSNEIIDLYSYSLINESLPLANQVYNKVHRL